MAITKSYVYRFLIIILIVFHSVNNYFWLKQDCESIMECCDVVHHTNITVLLHQEIENIAFSNTNPIEKLKLIFSLLGKGDLRWSYLVHLIAASVSSVSRNILFWIRFSNILYFIILIISVYLLGKKIYGPNAGIISAYIISFYPAIFGLSRKFGLDFPLTAIVCLTLYFLLSSDEFQNRLFTLMFGINLGLGMLIKGQQIIFIIGPLLYITFKGFKNKQHKISYFLNVLIAMSLALLISSIWWFKIFLKETREVIWVNLLPNHISLPLIFKDGGNILKFHLKGIILNVSWGFFVMFLTGLFFYLKKLNKNKLFVILWLFVSYIILAFYINFNPTILLRNDYRHVFPVYGAVALISAIGWLESSIRRNIKIVLMSLFILIGIWQFFIVSYYSCYHFVDYRYVHPPEKNNHRLIMEGFNRVIQSYNSIGKNIAIVEEDYFYNDKCVRLSYFLKIFNQENIIFLSARGVIPSQVADEFLSNVNNYEFLIAFSESSLEPGFSGLLKFSKNSDKELIIEIIKKFRGFKILKKDLLSPEKINIFLLKR